MNGLRRRAKSAFSLARKRPVLGFVIVAGIAFITVQKFSTWMTPPETEEFFCPELASHTDKIAAQYAASLPMTEKESEAWLNRQSASFDAVISECEVRRDSAFRDPHFAETEAHKRTGLFGSIWQPGEDTGFLGRFWNRFVANEERAARGRKRPLSE